MTETVELKPCPMGTAPKDGSMLRLFCRFDGDSSTGAFEDADEGWTIGTNNMANTGEDVWDVVGWDWEQDTFRQAHTAHPLGWLPFHAVSDPAVRDRVTDEKTDSVLAIQSSEIEPLTSPPEPASGWVMVTDEMVEAGAQALSKMYHGDNKDEPFGMMARKVLIAALTPPAKEPQ